MADASAATTRLLALIREEASGVDTIAGLLDPLPHGERLVAVRSLGRADQRRLWHKAAQAAPLGMDDFVPPAVGRRAQVIHHGRNTLPLPSSQRLFQKRFCRPAEGDERLFGYNQAPSTGLIGPGYFVVIPTAGNSEWEARGSIVVDYFQVPDADVVPGWPKVVPNSKGLQRLVYFHTRDFMRRISEQVTIGAAYKGEKALDHYFMLVRED